MYLRRMIKHLGSHTRKLSPHFSRRDLEDIAKAIMTSEAYHLGHICFAVEGALETSFLIKNQLPRERAIDVFSHLRVWDTELNNGVLIYVLLADHAVELVFDRGIGRKVQPQQWAQICQHMEADFAHGRYKEGVLSGIEKITLLLRQYFPRQPVTSEQIQPIHFKDQTLSSGDQSAEVFLHLVFDECPFIVCKQT